MSPDFKKINQDFEIYIKNILIKSAIVSVILALIAFIILFLRLLSFNIELQKEHIEKYSQIINNQIDYISNHIVTLKNSFVSFKKFDHKYVFDKKKSSKDSLNRYIYNSNEIGTFISLYKPINVFLDEFSALEHLSVQIKNFQKIDYILWTYYYSKNKFVYVHPKIKNPITYKFSELSYAGDILENTATVNKPYISPIYQDAITNKKVFSLTIPLFQNSNYQGTFAIDIDLEKLFQSVTNLNKNTKNVDLFLVDRKNQHYSLEDEIINSSWFHFNEHSNIKSGFNFKQMKVYNSQKIVDGTVLVSSFSIKNILYNSLYDPNLIYFIFVLGIFYLFISLTYFRYIKPQQSILIGVLEYLDSNKDTKESKLNKITKEVYKAFKYLISEFTLKIKIDNDIRHSKETIEYFIKSHHSDDYCGYLINPAFNFSGDYVKIFDLGQSKRIYFIADVSGKGVGAMILVNQIDFFFNFHLKKIIDLKSFESVLEEFNLYFVEKNMNCNFIAFKAIYINKNEEKLAIINAGFPNIYYCNHQNQIKELNNINSYTPLGIIENEKYEFNEIKISDSIHYIFSTTDGILEQMNKNGLIYQSKFVTVLDESLKFEKIPDMIKYIWNDFFSFIDAYENQYDDFTLLIIKV